MKSRAGKTVLIVLNALLLVQYAALIFLILSMYKFIPWYDADGNYMWIYYVLWIPLCVTTVAIVAMNIASKTIYRGRIMLLCCNAIFIPLLFLLGYASSELLCVIAASLALVTVVAYYIVFFRALHKKQL